MWVFFSPHSFFLLFCFSQQATWSTAPRTMMSSTTDGPPDSPVGHTCLWRTSNPTLGNTEHVQFVYTPSCTHTHNTQAQRGFKVTTWIELSGSLAHSILTHGSLRKFTSKHCKFVMFVIKLQVLGCGLVVFISSCLYHIMHRILNLSWCLCMRSCLHVDLGLIPCICAIWTQAACNQSWLWVGWWYCDVCVKE